MHYTPGSTTFTWMGEVTGYYDFMYSTVTRPGYYTDEKSYIMQSNLYDAASRQIMWSVIPPDQCPSDWINSQRQSCMEASGLAKAIWKSEKVLKKVTAASLIHGEALPPPGQLLYEQRKIIDPLYR